MTPYDPVRHGPRRIVGPGFHQQVHDLVRTVPAGAVTTFGDVAAALGSKNVARHVGYALAALPDGTDVPWWRVVNAQGRLPRPDACPNQLQAERLRDEGVDVDGPRILEFARVRHAFS